MSHTKELLGKILVDNNFCLPEQVEEALEYQKSRDLPIGKALVELGYVLEHQVLQALAIQFDLPFDDLLTLEKGETAEVPEARPENRDPASGDDPAAPPKVLIFPYHQGMKLALFCGGLFLFYVGLVSLISILATSGGSGLGEHVKNSEPVFFLVPLALAVLGFVITAYIARFSRIRIDDQGVHQQGIGGWFVAWDDIESVRIRHSTAFEQSPHLSLFLITHLGPNQEIRSRGVDSLQPIERAIQAGVERAGEATTLEGSPVHLASIQSEQPTDKSLGSSCLRIFVLAAGGFTCIFLIPLLGSFLVFYFFERAVGGLGELGTSLMTSLTLLLMLPFGFFVCIPYVFKLLDRLDRSPSGNKSDP